MTAAERSSVLQKGRQNDDHIACGYMNVTVLDTSPIVIEANWNGPGKLSERVCCIVADIARVELGHPSAICSLTVWVFSFCYRRE